MSQPLSITFEEWRANEFRAQVEEPGSRYQGLLDDVTSSGASPMEALKGIAFAIENAEKVIQERKAKEEPE